MCAVAGDGLTITMVHARKAEIPEGLDELCRFARIRAQAAVQRVRDLDELLRELDKRVRSQIARLKFTSMFRDADDDTKKEMMDIMIRDGRNTRIAEAKMYAFLSRRSQESLSIRKVQRASFPKRRADNSDNSPALSECNPLRLDLIA